MNYLPDMINSSKISSSSGLNCKSENDTISSSSSSSASIFVMFFSGSVNCEENKVEIGACMIQKNVGEGIVQEIGVTDVGGEEDGCYGGK